MLTETAHTTTLQFIRCGVAEETYGLDMTWVRSIQRLDRLRRNKDGGDPAGWLPVGESGIPVFSLAARLGLPVKTGGDLQRVVVLNSAHRPWAILVDHVSQVERVPANRVAPLPPLAVNPSFSRFDGIIQTPEQLNLLLSPERIHPDATPAAERVESPAVHRTSVKPPPPGARRSSHGRILVFSLKPCPDERPIVFGLSISQVQEVITPLPLIPVPGAPFFVDGLLSWRNSPVPIVDLAACMRMPALPASEQSCIMIVRGSDKHSLAGFRIRPDVRVLRLPIAHEPRDRELPFDRSLVRGAFELEKETLVIPDLQRCYRVNDQLEIDTPFIDGDCDRSRCLIQSNPDAPRRCSASDYA